MVKVKRSKAVPLLAMLDLRNRVGVSGQRNVPATVYSRERTPPKHIGYKAGWASQLVLTQRLECTLAVILIKCHNLIGL